MTTFANCPNCGAPIHDYICEYCGTVFATNRPYEYIFYTDSDIYTGFQTSKESRIQQAEERRKKVEMQLTDSKYGIVYIDSTEKIVLHNRFNNYIL